MPLIFTYKYGCGGIGDFLRSVFAFYVFCKKNEINFYLYFDDHPFKYCFKEQEIPDNFKINLKTLVNVPGLRNYEDIKIILQKLRENKNNNYIILSNTFDFVSFEELEENRKSFLEFLNLSELVKERIIELKKNFDNNYSVIHIRCGDMFMKTQNIICDGRLNPNSEELIEDIIKICFVLQKQKEQKIILMTDSDILKNNLKNNEETRELLTFLETNIYHTSLKGNEKGIIDSFIEFIIMGNSKTNVQFSNSGFSFWSSFIFDVPLYKVSKENESIELVRIKNEDLKY